MGTKQTLQIPETNAPLNMPNSFLYGETINLLLNTEIDEILNNSTFLVEEE